MPARGQATFFRENVNSYVAFMFIGVYSLGVGLILWYAAFGHNPVADLMVQQMRADAMQN